MTPINFPEQNFSFGPPLGVSENECGTMPCFKGTEKGGHWPVIISAWKPNKEELAEINNTGLVWLRVYSTGMFPVALSGHSPWPKCQASNATPMVDPYLLKKVGDLYEEGKDCLHSMSILSDEMQHRDRLYEVLKELRDLAVTQAKLNL